MVRRSSLALVAIVAMVAALFVATPPANALRVTPGGHFYFNTWEQNLILDTGAGYAAARLGCGPVCGAAVTVASSFLFTHGICSQGRYLHVWMVGVPIYIGCVSGLPCCTLPYNPAGGGGGGGSWRGSYVRY